MKKATAKIVMVAMTLTVCIPLVAKAQRRVPVRPPAGVEEATEATWLDSFEEGLTRAKGAGRYMLVNFGGSDWCGWCQKLNSEVYQSQEFRSYAAANLVLVDLDTPKASMSSNPQPHAELKQKYGVKGFPTVLLFDPQGELAHRTGYVRGGGVAFVKEISPHVKAPASQLRRRVPPPALPDLPADWDSLKKELSGMEPAAARARFERIVRGLAIEQHKWMPKRRVYIDDFCALCDVLPEAPQQKEIKSLALLLGAVNKQVDNSKRLATRINEGLRYFGGAEKSNRYRAAELLFTAGLQAEAAKFLDPLSEIGDAPLDVVDLHLDVWLQAPVTQRSIETTEAMRELLIKRIRGNQSGGKQVADDIERLLDLLMSTGEVNSIPQVKLLAEGRPDLAETLLVKAAERQKKAIDSKRIDQREQALRLRQNIVEGVLEHTGKLSQPALSALDALAWMWVNEVRESIKAATAAARVRRSSSSENRTKTVGSEALRISAPSGRFKGLLAEELNREILQAEIRVLMLRHHPTEAVDRILALQSIDPGAASAVAADLLDAWGSMFDSRNDRYRSSSYGGFAGRRSMHATYISQRRVYPVPVTNSRREDMKQMLAEVRDAFLEAGVKLEDDRYWIQAFAACHLGDQVYREEELEKVFGPIDAMPASLARALVTDLWGKAEGRWKPSKEELEGEPSLIVKEKIAKMRATFALAKRTIASAAQRNAGNYELFVTYGALLDSEAEALKALSLSEAYADEIKGVEYRRKKEAAIEALLGAAASYGSEMEQMLLQSEVPRLVQFLFSAAVSALDTSTDLGEKTLVAVRELILSVPETHREATMQVFADWAQRAVSQVPPDRKYHWLQQAQKVVGEIGDVSSIQEKIDLYDEVLSEVELHTELDGSRRVAVGQQFGLVITLKHSDAFGAPGSGVSGFIANVVNSRSQAVDYQTLEKIIVMTLQDQFDVESVVFRSADLPAFASDRPGWRNAPLAYVVLAARSTATDRVPPLQFDFEFNGSEGHIVIPVRSSPLMIGVEEEKTGVRPVEQVEVVQVLDERNLGAGLLGLEVTVTGRGLVPDYEFCFGEGLAGCREVSRATDGLVVKTLDVSETGTSVISERNWILELEVDTADLPDPLQLPLCVLNGAEVTYQRYAGSDIDTIGRNVTLGTMPASIGRQALWVVVGLVVVVGLFLAGRRFIPRGVQKEERVSYEMPSDVNAFTVLGLLERVQQDRRIGLSPSQQEALSGDVASIKQNYFSSDTRAAGESDLRELAVRWLGVTGFTGPVK